MRIFVGVTAAAAMTLLFTATSARADDWPSHGLTAARARATAERSGPQFRSQAWTYVAAGTHWNLSSPAVADGVVVFGTQDGTVHALRASTGKRLWQFKAKDGIVASPAIHRGRVFVAALDSTLYALRLSDGALIWSKDLVGLSQSSPTIVEDSLILAAGYPVRKLLRIDARTGTTQWETSADVMAQFSNSAAASDGQQVIIGAQEGHLYSFDLATGAHRWTYEAEGIINFAAPLIVGDRVYLLPGGNSGRLHAVELDSGRAVTGWPIDLPLVGMEPAIVGKMLNRSYAVSSLVWAAEQRRLLFDVRIDDSMDTNKDNLPDKFVLREIVMAASASDGQVVWQEENGNGTRDSTNDVPKNWLCPTPVLFANGESGTPLIAVASTLTPALRTLDVVGGTVRGTLKVASPLRSSPVLANGRLFAASENGSLHAYLSSANRPPDVPVLTGAVGRPLSATAATVRWAAAMDPDGDTVSYRVRFDRDGEILETWQAELAPVVGDTSVRVPQALQVGATYTFAVRARDSKGAWSDWSETQSLQAAEMPSVTVDGAAHTSLGAALAAAASVGGVVRLGAGTFYLSEPLRVPAGVSLEGAGAHQTILDAAGQPTGISVEGTIEGKPTEIKGLTVTGAQVGISIRDAHDVRIKNVIARDNREAGIEIGAAGSASIVNVTLLGNGRGVRSFGAATIKNSIVVGNQTGLVAGRADALVSKFNDVIGNAVAFEGMVRASTDLAREVSFINYAKRDLRLQRGQASTDQGDPADDFTAEPPPNGGRINLGAFGGTAEAELSAAAPPVTAGTGPASSGGGCAAGGALDPTQTRGLLTVTLIFAALLLVIRGRRRSATGLLLLACLSPRPSGAITCTWKSSSGGSGGAFSTAANWVKTGTGGSANCPPAANDTAVFSSGSQACTITADVSVGTFTTNSTYSGTISQSTYAITTSSDFNAGAGTFTGGSGDIVVGNDFNLSGGTFTTTSGLLDVRGAFNKTGGTFTHNSGRVLLSSSSSEAFASSGATFNNLYINDGLVGYWKLDETSGTAAADSSGYGNTGTLTGSPTISSTVPTLNYTNLRSVQFSGSNYIVTGTLPTELMPSTLTVSAWYKATSVDSGGADIVSGSNRYIFRVNTAGAVSLIKQTAAATWAFATATKADNLDGNWHHLAGTISGSTMTLYYDGVAAASTADATAIYYTSPVGMNIGRNPTATTYDFVGSIDDVRVYNRVLSASEIALMAAGSQPATGVATQTLSGNPIIAGDLTIGSGTLAAGNTTITVAGNWWNHGGIFTTGSTGNVSFNGSTTGKYILGGGSSFNDLSIAGSGSGAWTMADTDKVTLGGDLAISGGTLTATPGLLEIQGAFNKTAGTFTHNSGQVMLSSTASQTFASHSATFYDLTVNDGLLAYWKMDDTASPAVDASGFGRTATWGGGPAASSTVPTVNFANAKSLSIDSADDYATFTAPATSVITIAAWVRATAAGGGSYQRIMDAPGYTVFFNGAGLTAPDNPMSLALTSNRSTTGGEWKSPSNSITYGAWYHVAITYDSTNVANTPVLYINGVSQTVTTKTTPVGSQISNAGTAYIGNRADLARYFNGLIDEFRIYNRQLSAAEIYALYIGNQPGTGSGTQTLTGNPTVANDLVIASGTLAAGTTSLSVAGNWWNYGGLFTASSSGSVTFNGSASSKVIRSAGQLFGAVTINGSGSWTLGDRMEINPASTLTTTAGTMSLSSYTLRAGNVDKNGVALTTSTGKVVLGGNASFTTDQGAFTDLRVEPVTATELVGYWKLDAGQGTVAKDYSSGAHDGVITNGPLWASSGAPGVEYENPSSVYFDGTDDYIDISSTVTSTLAAFSACAWVKPTAVDSYRSFVSILGTTVAGFNLQTRVDTGKFAANMRSADSTGSTEYKADSTTTPVAGTWYHLCGTYDTANIRIYVNGALEGTTVRTGTWAAAGGHTYIGAGWWNSARADSAQGYIDDVRIYNVALSTAQVKALASGRYPGGTSGMPTYTLGANTTVSGNLAVDSGTLATSSYTMNASAAGNVAYVGSATYTVGSATSTFAGGLTVRDSGTMTLATSGGIVALGSSKTFTMDGTLNASSTGATIQSSSGYYTFSIGSTATATPTLNITGLAVKNPDTAGMNINVNHSASTTFTRFDNIAFSNGPTTAGARLLQIYAPALYLVSNGCSFNHTATTYNVTLTGDTSSSTETRVMFGNATCSPTTCEAYDNDDDSAADGAGDNMTTNGSVIQWVRSAQADTSGTIEGFPVAAFDWNTFSYYSTYVTYHDVGGGTADRVYLRDTNGNPKTTTSYWDTPSGVDLIGSPRYDTVSSVHYVYVATTAGKVYRLIDNTTTNTLTEDTSGNWSSGAYDCSCTITTPLTVDTNNIYWGGTASGNKIWTLGKTSRALASSSPVTVSAVVSGAAPTVWTDAASQVQMFMGSAAHFYKVNINTQTLTTDNSSPTGNVNGRISIINSKVYGADNRGSLWVLNPETFSTTLWSYHDDTNHNGCASGATCAVTSSLFVDAAYNRAYYGDNDGHLYASYNSTGTTGAQRTGFPYRPGSSSDVYGTAPLYLNGILVAGTTTGNLYLIDVNGGSGPVLKQTYKFGAATRVSGVGYDRNSSSFMVSTANATDKDGKLVYIDVMTDPTPGSI